MNSTENTDLRDAIVKSASVITPAPELCIVIPVLNEHENVVPLVDRIRVALDGISWEVIFVDDGSTDGTRDRIAEIGVYDARIRLLYRTGRKGLSSAFIEGAQSSIAPFIAAMDGDLQHDERLLPEMLRTLRDSRIEIAIGSRYVVGGGLGEWDRTRVGMSDMATRLSRLILRVPVADPMSGFFMVQRPVFDRAVPTLSAIGFKILLDLLASLPEKPRVVEIPYTFRARVAGDSKLDIGVLIDFGLLLLDKVVGGIVPARFVMFAIVGALGLLAHILVLRLALMSGAEFGVAQLIATVTAIIGNFWLNNEITFRDRRLGGVQLLRGLFIFTVVCGLGAIANLNVSSLLFSSGHETWWRAGVVGAAMSLVWNYAVGSTLTWRR